MYRVLDDEGDNSIVGICAGILQAISDNVDIISMSIAFADENGLTKSACKLAYEKIYLSFVVLVTRAEI